MLYFLFLCLPLIETQEIGKKIWKNECNKTIDGLVFWNPHENCLSLGIGHFIWYPEGTKSQFDAGYPQYVAFLREKNIPVPFPTFSWKSREEFLDSSEQVTSLKKWLLETIDLQTEFMIHRLDCSLTKIIHKAPELEKRILSLKQTSAGLFALIDYLNFKGEGLSPEERYQGKGWGLYQVFMEMRDDSLEAFKCSCIERLETRVKLAPKDESRWLAGWKNRVNAY